MAPTVLKATITSSKPASDVLERPMSSPSQPMALSHVHLPNFEQTKYSMKENGVVKAYAANTNQGIVRDYNED